MSGESLRRRTLAGVVSLVVVALTSCGFDSGGILVGATNFTESRVLANIYAQALSNAGMAATVKELTTREIVEPALERGQLQVVPEYLGTFTEYLNVKENGPDAAPLASNDPKQTLVAAQPLANAVGLTVLQPSRAQDQNAFAVMREFAETNQLSTLSQLGPFSQDHPIVLGAGPDCPSRPFCEPGLEQTYGIRFAEFVALDSGGPLTVQALLQGRINLALVFSSSGYIAAYDLVVLDDDKHLQTADNITPVVNSEALTDDMRTVLDGVSARLTTEDLQTMNAQVDLERQSPSEVAAAWLQRAGLANSVPR